jgi:hypothetical protein
VLTTFCVCDVFSDPGIVYKRAVVDENLNAVEDATAIPCGKYVSLSVLLIDE